MKHSAILAAIVMSACLVSAAPLRAASKVQLKIDNKTSAGSDGKPYYLLFPEYSGDGDPVVEIKDEDDSSLKTDALKEAKPVALLPGHIYQVTYRLKKASSNATEMNFYLADYRAKDRDNKRLVALGECFHMVLPMGSVEHVQTSLSNQRNVQGTLKKNLNPDTPAKDTTVHSIVILKNAYTIIRNKPWDDLLAGIPQRGGTLVTAIFSNPAYRKDFLDWILPLAKESFALENIVFLQAYYANGDLSAQDKKALFKKYIPNDAKYPINISDGIRKKLVDAEAAGKDLDFTEAVTEIAKLVSVNQFGKGLKRLSDYLSMIELDYSL